MADTSQSEQPSQASEPQTNGLPDGVEEDEKTKMRPADIDADMREMERRKRVEMIMNSRLFREELERIIESQLKDGNGPAGLLQQISDMMGMQGGRLQSGNVFRSASCVVPINDIRGVESMGYAKGEKILRCKLAAVYRLMDLYGWSQGVYNHITARLNQDQEHFLVNPFGMLYHEITASSLVKIDMQGNIVESGTTNFGVNATGFLLHAAIHAARPDVKCIIHVHTPSVLAVSSLKCGLLPLCQEAVVVGEISQHPYLGGLSEPEEREKIARNLGPLNKVMFLTNHGVVCCGETVEEAFFNVYNTVLACETQIKLMPMGVDNLVLVSDEARKQIYEAARRPPDSAIKQPDPADLPPSGIKKEKQWRVGGIEFEALMRMLDNAGFRTGYIYRHPLVKGEPPRPRNDVEVPPAVSSLGYLLEEEEMYKQGHWKKYVDGRKTHDRTRWLNSPNVYQKVEILETGTPDPKKITKWVDANAEEWVAEGSPTHSSTPVKIESALQFVPKNTDPREFKKLQQQIKDNRRSDKITSGPQSHILEGVSWEEAKKLQDANISATGDQVILVGAASKGIIQRGFQHNALVYKTPYAKNPFDTITDEELEEYKKVVERKQRGESFDEEQSESEPLSSSLHNSRPTNEESVSAAKSPLLSPTSAASETEEESRDEPRVLRIETKQVPRPSQAEVVLSDAEGDLPDPGVERTMSLRYPSKAPDSPAESDQFKRTWSLPPDQMKKKDHNEKVARDTRDQLQQELKTNAFNHHSLCHSYNNSTLKHRYPCTCFPPLGILPQASKQACFTNCTSLSSLPSITRGIHQKREKYPNSVVGCRITRFAKIPFLQRKEIAEVFYSSQSKGLLMKNVPKCFFKTENIFGNTTHSDFDTTGENLLNSFRQFDSPCKFVDSEFLSCHGESHQRLSLVSLQTCSLLSPSDCISRRLNIVSTNNVKLDIKDEKNAFNIKHEQMQLMKEEIDKNAIKFNKCNLKTVLNTSKMNSTRNDMVEHDKVYTRGMRSFIDIREYSKVRNLTSEVYESNNSNTNGEIRKTVMTAEVSQFSVHNDSGALIISWPKHGNQSSLTTSQIENVISQLDSDIPSTIVEVTAVNKYSKSLPLAKYMVDVTSLSVIENIGKMHEITGPTNNIEENDKIDISIKNFNFDDDNNQDFSGDDAKRRDTLEKGTYTKRVSDVLILLHDKQTTENKISERFSISPERNLDISIIADTSVSLKDNLLCSEDNQIKKQIDLGFVFDSESVCGNKNNSYFNSQNFVGDKKQKIVNVPYELSGILGKPRVDPYNFTCNVHRKCSRSEKQIDWNVQRNLKDIMEAELELHVTEKETDANKHFENYNSGSYFSMHFSNFCEEGHSVTPCFNKNASFKIDKLLKEFRNNNVKDYDYHTTILDDTVEDQHAFVLLGLDNMDREIGTDGKKSSIGIIDNYEDLSFDHQETLVIECSKNCLLPESFEYLLAEKFDHNNNTNHIVKEEGMKGSDGAIPFEIEQDNSNAFEHKHEVYQTEMQDDKITADDGLHNCYLTPFIPNSSHNKKYNSYVLKSFNCNKNILCESKHKCSIWAGNLDEDQENAFLKFCVIVDENMDHRSAENCSVDSQETVMAFFLIYKALQCDCIFHLIKNPHIDYEDQDKKVKRHLIKIKRQGEKEAAGKQVEIKKINESQEISSSLDNMKIAFSEFRNKKKIQGVISCSCSRHDKIHTRYATSFSKMFGKVILVKHFNSKCKSLEIVSHSNNEYKYIGTSIAHNEFIHLLINNTNYNFNGETKFTALLCGNPVLSDARFDRHMEVNQFKLKKNECSFFRLHGNMVTSEHFLNEKANVTNKCKYTNLLYFSATYCWSEPTIIFSEDCIVVVNLSTKNCSQFQQKKPKCVLRNALAKYSGEIIPFCCSDACFFSTLIPNKSKLTFIDKRCKIIDIRSPFLHTIHLGNSCESFLFQMERIFQTSNLKMDIKCEYLYNVPWKRNKAVVLYCEGLYEKIILHQNYKTSHFHRGNFGTCFIRRGMMKTFSSLGENYKLWYSGSIFKLNFIDVKLLPPFQVHADCEFIASALVNSTSSYKNAPSQLKSYFSNNLYFISLESNPKEKDEGSCWPTGFDNEILSLTSDFTDTGDVLLASQTNCKDCDSTSSLCSSNSSNCSCKFSSTVPSDLSLSSSSLDIVTALTEVPSLSVENPSLDYYSFSSPILDMEDPEFSLSDIQESNITGSLNETQSLNLSSDLSFTTQDLELSNSFSHPQSMNSQKSEAGLSPYLKICFSSSESLSCNNLSKDDTNISNFCGNSFLVSPEVDEMHIPAEQIFSPNTSPTYSSDRKNSSELTCNSCSFLCCECESKTSLNKSYCECISSDSGCSQCIPTKYHFSADYKVADSSCKNNHFVSRVCEPVQAECKVAISFNPKHQKIYTEGQKSKSACGKISVEIEVDCSTEQEDECQLVSIRNCVVGYKPHAKRKYIHQNNDVERKGCDIKNSPQRQFDTGFKNYQKDYKFKNSNSKFYQRIPKQIGKKGKPRKNSIRQPIVKSKSYQDVSFFKKINDNILPEVNKSSMDESEYSVFMNYTPGKRRSLANMRVKSHSYQNIMHEAYMEEELYLRKRTSRRRTIDTFFIDGEHIFAVLTPEHLSPEKRPNEASGLPKILSDYSDNEMCEVAPETDWSSSNFTEYIDSLDYSPVTQPNSCLSDISSLSSLPVDRVPFSDVDSPAVPEQ